MRRKDAAVGGLLERDETLALVTRVAEGALAGSGAVMTITGPPGVGKSALLDAVGAITAEQGFRVVRASGGELELDFPFGVVRQLFGSGAADLGGGASAAERVFHAVTGETPVTESSYEVLRGLYWLVAQSADETPMAVLVDDAHWSDLGTLRFIDYLSRRLDDLRVLVVLAARDTEPETQDQLRVIESLSRAESVRLGLLSQESTERLLSDHLGTKPDGAFAAAAHRITGGNPFLVGELGRELARIELEPITSNVGLLGEVLPGSVGARVMNQLNKLGEVAAAVAEAVAVLGDGSPTRLVHLVLGTNADEVGGAADRLVDAGLLSDSRLLAFRHPLLRTAVLDGIPRARRSILHAQAAKSLMWEGAEPSRVASQLLHVEPRGDRETANLLRLGARESVGRGSPESAVAFLRRALDEIGGRDPERPSVLLELGSALASLDPLAGAEVLAEAARVADDPGVRNRAAAAAGYALCTAGRVREACRLVDGYVEDITDGREPSARALARMAAELQWTLGDSFEDALGAARRYWSWSEDATEELAVVAAGKAYVECVTLGDLAVARNLALAAARDESLIRRLGPGDYGAMAALVALVATDELTVARALCAQLKDAALRSGEPTALANCTLWSAWVNLAYGDLLSAEVDAGTALGITRDMSQFVGVPAATMAAILAERGDIAKAVAVVGEFSDDLDGPLDDRQKTMALIGRAGIHLAAGRFSAAVADLDRVAATNPPGGDRNPLLGWKEMRALALLATGRSDEAAREIADNLDQARRWGAPRRLSVALRIASRLEVEGSGRLALLREAVEVAESGQSRLEHAKAEVALGSELRRQGHRVEARSRLKTGHELASACGATGLAEFALAELVAGGSRPRRPRYVGPEALTASERRVAEMAADGMTNREIAEALFVSMKTVTFHLTNCYRKLGVSSRAELGQVIDRL